MEMMDANGNYIKDTNNNIQNNPYGILHGGEYDRKRTMVTGHVDLKFNLLKGLTFTTTNGIDYNDYKWYNFTSSKVNPLVTQWATTMQQLPLCSQPTT